MKKIRLTAILACLLLTGCKTRERIVMVETTRTDTTYITKHQRDSIWMHDSVYVSEKQRGDTLYIERTRWNIKYVERLTRDTIYICVRDSVPVPYPVEVEVPAPLTWWQQARLHLGNIALGVIVILTLTGIIRRRTGL